MRPGRQDARRQEPEEKGDVNMNDHDPGDEDSGPPSVEIEEIELLGDGAAACYIRFGREVPNAPVELLPLYDD